MTGSKRPIHTQPIVIVQNAQAIVGDTPIYALVELITNSDDSYSRMDRKGYKSSGIIHVELVRRRNDSVFRVVDQAEGLDQKEMDQKIAMYGGETIGREELNTRGYFMRGLKEAMVGMGYGRVRSIKDSFLYECEVDGDAYYTPRTPQKVTSRMKGELGVAETGTEVMLKATRDEIKIPQFENLKEQLEGYFSLRKILQDPKRMILLVEWNEKGGKKREPIRLSYKQPRGEKIFGDPLFMNYEGRKIDAKVEVWRSELPLSGKEEAGPYRENGLLISDGKAIHDITLFKYDNSPEAENIFGEVECHYIYELMDKGGQIVSSKRDQLNPRHPFTRILKDAVEKILEPILKEEKKRKEQERREIETRETRERFKNLLKDLDKIVKDEIGEISDTGLDEDKEKEPEVPENGFAFLPPITTVVSRKIKTLTLRALVPHVIPLHNEVKIESDCEEVLLHTPEVTFEESDLRGEIASKSVRIEGRQVGAIAAIVAKYGELKAECIVQVRSKPKEPVDTPPNNRRKGLFKDIKFDPKEDPRYRVNYDRNTGIITIATQAPSVKHVFRS